MSWKAGSKICQRRWSISTPLVSSRLIPRSTDERGEWRDVGAIPARLHSCGSCSLPNTALIIADFPSCFYPTPGDLLAPVSASGILQTPSQGTASSPSLPLARGFSCCSNASQAVIFNDVLMLAAVYGFTPAKEHFFSHWGNAKDFFQQKTP